MTQSPSLNLKMNSVKSSLLLVTLVISTLASIEASAKGCLLPWGGPLAEGDSTIAWNYSMPPPGTHCRSEIRSCEGGFLTGSFSAPRCAEPARWFYVPSVALSSPSTGANLGANLGTLLGTPSK